MKKVHNIYKSEKLIRISMELDETNNVIHRIKITGDFFLYPEDALETLETNLSNTKLEKAVIQKKIDQVLDTSETYGFDSESLTEAILGCSSRVD